MKPDGVFHCRFSGRNHETIYKAITYAAALLTAVMMLTALVTGSPAEAGSQPAELWPASGGDSLSGYGYVAADSAGIESNPGIPAENRVGTVYRYMLCRVTGTVSVNGIIWYEIGYSGQTGYINADDMIMLTDDELKAFIDSPDYWEGLRNNADGLVFFDPCARGRILL